MNVLFLIGIAIFLGIISGKVFQRFKIPQVVGYIILGVLIGKSFFHLFDSHVVRSLEPLVNLTLGIIGCVIGAELKGSVFKKFGRSIYTILLAEGLFAFFAVTVAVTLITKKLYLGLILGAIASATDPASTVSVLWEYKARGPLTRTLTSVIALDDGLALILYGLVSVFSKSMMMDQSFSLWEGLVTPLFEIVQCLILGGLSAVFVAKLCKHIKEESMVIAFILGVIAAGVGLSLYFQLDLILSSMAFGATMANIVPKISEKVFQTIKEMATSLYILFFVSIGAQLDMKTFLNVSLLGVIVAYLVMRSGGKILGAMLGGWLTRAPKAVTKYTGLCLFTQGGVAMGLALSITHNLGMAGPDGAAVGLLIINVVASTTFVVQLFGPPFVKYGITKANEVNKNVTREDVIDGLKVTDVMNRHFVAIPEQAYLKDVIQTVKNEDVLNYLLTDRDGNLKGVITLSALKDALFESELEDIVLAQDIASPAPFVLRPNQPLRAALEIFHNRHLEFVPVVDEKSNRILGIVEYSNLNDIVDKTLLERQYEEVE